MKLVGRRSALRGVVACVALLQCGAAARDDVWQANRSGDPLLVEPVQRFNFASLECAAGVVKANKNSAGAANILSGNKNTYMKNKCSEEKRYVVIELCDDILVENVVLANYEFFSSMFKDFRVSVSDRYPPSDVGWVSLGEFRAANNRVEQSFDIASPRIWARYLRLDFLSHWGDEFYCPLSVVRVHGSTMIDKFKQLPEGGAAADGNGSLLDNAAPAQPACKSSLDVCLVAEEALEAPLRSAAAAAADRCVSPYAQHPNLLEACPVAPANTLQVPMCFSCPKKAAAARPPAPSAEGVQASIFETMLTRIGKLEALVDELRRDAPAQAALRSTAALQSDLDVAVERGHAALARVASLAGAVRVTHALLLLNTLVNAFLVYKVWRLQRRPASIPIPALLKVPYCSETSDGLSDDDKY